MENCPHLHWLKFITLLLSSVLVVSALSFSVLSLGLSSFLFPLHFFLLITQLLGCLWPSVFSCIPNVEILHVLFQVLAAK